MESSSRSRRWSARASRLLPPTLVFCWPIAYLWIYVVSIRGKYMAIGNDFIVLYYSYKLYLLDELSRGRVPLWSPSEGAGFPFYASPFAAVLYPLNPLLTLYYRLSGGYTVLDHQRFTVLAVGIFALGLYLWLRSLALPLRPAIFAAMIMPVSFKVTEILRFPNAVHTAAWYPWVLYAFTMVMRSESLRSAAPYAALLVFCSICLLTGGYLYYVFYFTFLLLPYALLFAVSPMRRRVLGIGMIRWRHVAPIVALAGVAIAALCGPYLKAVSALLQETTDRAGKNFDYSTAFVFDRQDTLGSLIFPPASQAEGWYYFGAVSLLLIVVFVCSRSKELLERTDVAHSPGWTKAVLLTWWGLVTYITYGRDSALFVALWHYLPGFSSLRVWGRFNIVLVPLIAWLLALAYAHLEGLLTNPRPERRRAAMWALILVVAAGGAILSEQSFLLDRRIFDSYWTMWFISFDWKLVMDSTLGTGSLLGPANLSRPLAATFLMSAAAAVAVLVTLLALGRRRPFRTPRALAAVTAGLVLLAAIDLWTVGPFMWVNGVRNVEGRHKLGLDRLNVASLAVPRGGDVYTTLPLTAAFNVNTVPNWYFERYDRFLKWSAGELPARRRFLGQLDGRRIYCTSQVGQASLQAYLDDVDQMSGCQIAVVSYPGDAITVDATTDRNAFVSFIDNWQEGWTVSIDGQPAPLAVLFGTFKTVAIRPGQHRITFAYRPALLGP